MNKYLQNQYRETKSKFTKFSTRLQTSQERGDFHKLSRGKQNFLLNRVKRLWEKLRILEVQLKITTVGVSMALIMMVSNLSAQSQFTAAPEKNPLPPPSVFGFDPFLVDIDNDGDLDLLASSDYSSTDLFLNTGTASDPHFELVSSQDNPFAGISEEADFEVWDIIGSGDIDGDGDIDFLSDEGYIIRNIGSNSDLNYKEEQLQGYLNYNGTLGDIDGDGDLDFVYFGQNYEYGVGYYYTLMANENVGDENNFNLNTDTQISFAISNVDQDIDYFDNLVLVDLDNDGDLDILAGADSYSYDSYYNYMRDQGIKYIENTGTAQAPVFYMKDDSSNPYSSLNTNEVVFGDLDGDGDYDVILTDIYSGGGLKYYENSNNGLSENRDFIPEFSDGIVLSYSYFAPQFVDYDGDGDFDLFAWSYYSDNGNTIYLEYQDTGEQLKYVDRSNKNFAFLDEAIAYQIPIFVDFDFDGDIDVIRVEGNYNSDTEEETWMFSYLENTGSDANPVYSKHSIPALSTVNELFMPSFVDIDDDGDMDMFLSGEVYAGYDNWDALTRYFESTGSDPLEFTERTGANNPLDLLKEANYEDMMGYGVPVYSDIDEDGDFDVIYAGYYGIHFFENTGSATAPAFVDKSQSGPFSELSIGYYSTINLIDFDGDGDDDLFVHEVYGMITKYYENTGGSGSGTGNSIQNDKIQAIDVYPNPANHEINISLDNVDSSELRYAIVGMDGKQVMNGYTSIGNFGSFRISTEQLSKGYYILKLESDDNIYISKFVKE